MFGLGFPEVLILLLFVLVIPVLIIWPAMRICGRAGFSPWLGLLIVVPLANVLLLWFVAFSPWPALEANREMPGTRP
jgi:hypothetical protein